ncbi:hypothetical protein [Oricola cellulosilytica]|uniref:Uncharacterized protein n=1 Tax=Oricola cellulosilytica TaxID=1429082 RepID=A0A4R0PCH5_9HYPH|nr:hypothetical protein [Oricola cellulosilytica]TCD15171.1 hypothetical protein E0D97_06375 [Oricola cellulosilytica]
MIIYNVRRRFLAKKEDAETYRKAERLRPAFTLKIEVGSRDDLAALLNALCNPPAGAGADFPADEALIDRAQVPGPTSIPACVPDFLLTDEQRRQRNAERRTA